MSLIVSIGILALNQSQDFMKNLYKNQFVKSVGKRALFACVFFLATGYLWAQTPPYYNSNTGGSSNSFPLNSTTNKVQWIYDPGMFNSNGTSGGTPAFAGLITKVYWRIGTIVNPNSTYTNFTIKLAQNVGTQTSWSSNVWNTGMTTVFNASSYQITGSASGAWVSVTLQTPFVYDPSKSLVFEISTSGGTGNSVYQITNNGTRRMWGPSANAAPASRGTGLVDMGFDLVPLNVEVVSLTYPSTICEKEVVPVEVEIENTDISPQSGFLVEYKINGVTQAAEQYTGSIPAGQTASYIFNMPIDNATAGNFTLTANILGKSSFIQQNYTVNPSPTGSYVTEGSPFVGAFNSGDALDPDIVADGDQIRYSIEPPMGFNNSDYGSTWQFEFWELITVNGTSAGGAHSKTNPSGGNNAYSTFNPTTAHTDSSYLLRYAIRDLGNNCVAPVIERQLFVAPRPVAAFSANTACEGSSMNFKNNSSISSGWVDYVWRFGDGDSTVLINPSHRYQQAGSYTVELVAVSNYGYRNSTTQTVTVYENPTAEFGVSNVCEGSVTPFTDGSIIPAGTPTYEWNFGDGTTPGSGPNPTHQYTVPGVYNVTMKVTANGCSGQVSKQVTYAPRAVPDFSSNVVDCNNEEVQFSNKSTLAFGKMGYSWDFGDNSTSTSPNPSHDYSMHGTINVQLTVTTDMGCVDMVTKPLTLTEAPIADFTIQNLCDKDNVEFMNTSVEPSGANTGYEWRFADGTIFTTKDISRTFSSIGEYSLTLLAISDNGCIDEKKMTFSLDEEPSPVFFANDVCDGTPVEIQNSSTGNNGNYTSNWDFGGGNTSTDRNPMVTLPVGQHTVMLTVSTPSGCTASSTKTVTVHANPVVTGMQLESGQQGDGSMNLVAMVSPATAEYTVLWGDGGREEGNASGGSIIHSYRYLADGKYYVELKLNNAGCTTSETKSTDVHRTGLINLNTGQLKAYPNPSNGKFNIDLSSLNEGPVTITIHAANGQVVSGNTVINGNSVQLDLSTEAAGLYLVTVVTESGVYNARVTLSK